MARSGDAKRREPTPTEKLSLGRQQAKLEKANKVRPIEKPKEDKK